MPNTIVKKTPDEGDLSAWITTAPGFIQGLTSGDNGPTKITPYQLAHLNDTHKFRIREKARGVGFSFICAAEALAKAHLKDDYTAVFISMNLEEAIEKIRYANALYESLPLRWQKKKVIDNRTSIEFADATGRHRARLVSHPCKDPRGKHKADVFLDEFAHYGHKQRSVYIASVPVVSRGEGSLTIGSTPLASGDLFHDIMKEERKKYPMFSRMSIPWYACPDFCNDAEKAMMKAPGMDTSERVHAFGKEIIVDIFYSMELEDFQQEYELFYADESRSYFSYELIFSCCSDELVTYENVDRMLTGTTGELYCGFDVGRTRNKSELIILERKGNRLYYRMGREYDRSKFKAQEWSLKKLLKSSSRFKRLCIDRHGIGMNLAENLRSEFGARVEGVALVGQVKEALAVDLHIVFENEELQIPRNRELTNQIHSIKKTATEAGYSRYDTEKNESHHADKMWALALAVHAAGAKKGRRRRTKSVSASII